MTMGNCNTNRTIFVFLVFLFAFLIVTRISLYTWSEINSGMSDEYYNQIYLPNQTESYGIRQLESGIPLFYIYNVDWIISDFLTLLSHCEANNARVKYECHLIDDQFIKQLLNHPNRITQIHELDKVQVFILPILYDIGIYCDEQLIHEAGQQFFNSSINTELKIYNKYKQIVPHIYTAHHWRMRWNFIPIVFNSTNATTFALYMENAGSKERQKYQIITPYLANLFILISKHTSFEQWKSRKINIYFRGSSRRGNNNKKGKEARLAACHHKFPNHLENVLICQREIVNDDKPGALQLRMEYAQQIIDSKYCFNIIGDTLSSSRFYDMIAADCIPIIISDGWIDSSAPFKSAIDYDKFCYFISQTIFLNEERAQKAIQNILDNGTAQEIQKRLDYMNEIKPYLLWNLDDSKVAEMVIKTTYLRFIEIQKNKL
eukprot:251268_1